MLIPNAAPRVYRILKYIDFHRKTSLVLLISLRVLGTGVKRENPDVPRPWNDSGQVVDPMLLYLIPFSKECDR